MTLEWLLKPVNESSSCPRDRPSRKPLSANYLTILNTHIHKDRLNQFQMPVREKIDFTRLLGVYRLLVLSSKDVNSEIAVRLLLIAVSMKIRLFIILQIHKKHAAFYMTKTKR